MTLPKRTSTLLFVNVYALRLWRQRFNIAFEPIHIAFRGPTHLSATTFSLSLSVSASTYSVSKYIKMVQLTISAAPKYTARGLPLTIDVTPEATVGDVKAAVAANFSKVCNVSLVGTGPRGLDAPTRGMLHGHVTTAFCLFVCYPFAVY
jgi:hypothetical protein